MKRSGKILLEGTIEEFKKHCKGADNREYLLINTKEIKKDGIYTIYQLDSNTERVVSISTKGKHGKQPFVPYDKQYLTFTALSNGTFLFTGKGTNAILYSTDNGETWSESSQTVEINVKKGNSVLWKGEMTPYYDYRRGIGTFNGTATFEAKGNVMSLLFGDNYINKTSLEGKPSAFSSLWLGSKIVKAHNLSLPATILSLSCYNCMFYECTSLITAPQLPATTLANFCYGEMFSGCTSLTTAPLLPATVLTDGCYILMFSGTNVLPDCTNIDFTSQTVVASGGLKGLFGKTKVTDNDLMSILPINPQTNHYWLPVITLASGCYYQMFEYCQYLVTAPELPAITLADNCYQCMFQGCTSLIKAPELPATTLVNSCYRMMFEGCTHLNHIIMLATNISATQCLYYWVENVAETGTMVVNGIDLPVGNNGVPSGWTVQDLIHNYSKDYLTFVATSGGTFLFTGQGTNTILYSTDNGETWSDPAGSVTINVNEGNRIMWRGEMTPVNGGPPYARGIGNFKGSTAQFNIEGNIMSLLYGSNFVGQTDLSGKSKAFYSLFSQTNVINAYNFILPATTLADNCYENMFEICTSLIQAPRLLATTLTSSCYLYMFRECTSLTAAPTLPATILSNGCYYGMFYSCTSLTTAPQLPATTLVSNCYSYMFKNCTNLSSITMLATDISAEGCLSRWTDGGVAASGTFVKNANAPALLNLYIPSGWTVEDATE